MLGHFSLALSSHCPIHTCMITGLSQLTFKMLDLLGENNDNAPYLMNASVLALGSPFRGGVVL